MEDSEIKLLLQELSGLKERLRKVEKKVFPAAYSDDVTPPLPAEAQTTVPSSGGKAAQTVLPPRPDFSMKSGNLLGYIGVGCFILAMLLLIKFSIDSGWLTPVRQMILASLFGLALIIAPGLTDKKDLAYLAMLPAGGIVVLHLVVYGAVFYHELLHPSLGLIAISLIGAQSLILLKNYKENTYAVLSIAGTYLGAMALARGFVQDYQFAVFVILWSIIFCSIAIHLQNRALITLAAYFSLMIVALASFGTNERNLLIQVVLIQVVQIVIYSLSTARYSLINKVTLTKSETIQLLPVYLFFYGHLFHVLDYLSPPSAIVFSIIFALTLLGLVIFTEKKNGAVLESKPIILTYVSVLLAHSVFFVWMNDLSQFIFVSLVLIALASNFGRSSAPNKDPFGVLSVIALVCGFAFLKVFFHEGSVTKDLFILFGFIYGGSLCGFVFRQNETFNNFIRLILAVAHIQVLVAISRLDLYIHSWLEAPIGVVYASFIMFIGYKKNSRYIAKSSFIPLGWCLISFLIYNFGSFSTGQKIIGLLGMGAMIYLGGFFYRKIDE
jgi:hypothetical protein